MIIAQLPTTSVAHIGDIFIAVVAICLGVNAVWTLIERMLRARNGKAHVTRDEHEELRKRCEKLDKRVDELTEALASTDKARMTKLLTMVEHLTESFNKLEVRRR